MKRDAYLTIDDSPSSKTDDLTDALKRRGVPAVLFCRGDLLEQNPEPIIRAIQKGFVIANHGYWHKRSSTLGYEVMCESIERTDALIEACYRQASVIRPAKFYRFAYLDRGMGSWFVEPEKLNESHLETISNIIKTGLGNDPETKPTPDQIELKNKLQEKLKSMGYTQVPFQNITHEFYTETEMAETVDAMFTYSTSDWAVTARHSGKFGYSAADDLKRKIDTDASLQKTDTAHIILAHDQDELFETVVTLVDHMQTQGFIFKDIL